MVCKCSSQLGAQKLSGYLSALSVLLIAIASSQAQSEILHSALENAYRRDFCSYTVLHRIRSQTTGDTISFKYFVTLVRNGGKFSYSVFLNDSLLDVYYNDILVSANINRAEYTIEQVDRDEICADKSYLFRPLVDEEFKDLIVDDSATQIRLFKDNTLYRYEVSYTDPGDLDDLAFILEVPMNEITITKYIIKASIAGVSIWESWELLTKDSCNREALDEDIPKQFFKILLTMRPKCTVDESYKTKAEIDSNETPVIHERLPFLTLISLNGDSLMISKINSKYYLIDYWYRACYGCLKAMPILKELSREMREDILTIISINNVDRSTNGLQEFVIKNSIPYPVITESVELGKDFEGIGSYPTFVIYDEKFEVVKILHGYTDNLKQKILEIVMPGNN